MRALLNLATGERNIRHLRVGEPLSCRAQVFVDGKEFDYCTEADADDGWAEGFRLRDGRPYIEAGELPRHRVYGRIEIRVP